MNKTLKYGIATVFIAGGLLFGPKAYNKYQEKKAKVKAHMEQEKERAWAEQDAQYEQYIVDSVLKAKGFSAADKDLYCTSLEIGQQIYELSWQNTAGGALEKAVFAAGEQIIRKHMDTLIMDVAKYGLEISNITDITNDMCQNPELIMYGAYRDAKAEGLYDETDYFVSQITKNINMSSYGEARQQEIIDIVDTDFSAMLSALYASRKHIEQTFADYFPGGQQCLDENAVTYSNRSECWAKYFADNLCYPYRITTRSVRVYDSKLPVDFFGDKDAMYTLEQVSKGQWRVVKKYKNGKVVKTPVFQHDIDYTVSTYGSMSDTTDQPFAFYPGTNMGVHVMVNEVINVQKAKKQFKPSPIIDKQIDSLSVKRDSVRRRNAEYEKAVFAADSVAQIKLKQRITQRTRVK